MIYNRAPMMNWIISNQVFLGALSSVILAVLTAILLILNYIYVRSSWKMMKTMEADVRFRITPVLNVSVTLSVAKPEIVGFTIIIEPTNAPVRLMGGKLKLFSSSTEHFEAAEYELKNQSAVIPLGDRWDCQDSVKIPSRAALTWFLEVTYSDVAEVYLHTERRDSEHPKRTFVTNYKY